MIKEKTVFVFGAGLSSDYGFPRGHILRDKIIELLRWEPSNPDLPQQIKILKRLNYNLDQIKEFTERLQEGGFDTIDEFLEARPDSVTLQLGKVGIAMALIMHENHRTLFGISGKFSGNCFYRFLFSKMAMNSSPENFAENSVSFITYNYDRSFEHFLWTTLRRRYKLSIEEADEIIKKIKIVHVHGMLGQMRWESNNARAYEQLLDELSLLIASKEIVSFNEVEADFKQYQESHRLLNAAENVIFVGFGFHHRNLTRLIEDVNLTNKKRIFATSQGLDNQKLKEIEKITEGRLSSGNVLSSGNMFPMNAVQFAQSHLNWLGE